MSYVTIKDLPEIQTIDLSGNEYIMVTDETSSVSSKFSVDSMVVYVGEHFDNTVDSKLALKVDKVTGKGLSTEDFSTLEKTKLSSLENYVHPESGVTAGDYTKVSVDINGHVTAGTNPTTLQGYSITDAVNTSLIGAPNGIATLDVDGIVDLSQLPVNILEYASISLFPVSGESNKIYVLVDTNKSYRWNGTNYVQLGSLVDSVSGRTGSILLSKVDVQLNNVDNTSDATKNVLSATKLTTARTINNVSFDGASNIIIEANDPNKVTSNTPILGGTSTKLTYDSKGLITAGTSLSSSDIPSLDADKITSGIISADRLPSYVDDILEFADLSSFPVTGETGKIYIALDTNKAYRWSGSVYIYITSGAVDSVAGKTGVVILDKSDVQLNNVDNTSDIDKPISTATQTALDLKADKSTTLTGYGITDAYTKTEVQTVLPAIGLDTTNIVAPTRVGQMKWNQTEGTADLHLMNGVTLQLGQENNRIVRATSNIINGRLCMFDGTMGNSGRVKVKHFTAGFDEHPYIYGVATQDITSGSDGYITISGKVRGIDTSGASVGEIWNDDDILYAKANDSGMMTNIEPGDDELKMIVASVINAHATNGTLEVRVLPFNENMIAKRANKLTTARSIEVSGAVTGSVSFDGSGDVNIFSTLSAIDCGEII